LLRTGYYVIIAWTMYHKSQRML